MVCYGCRSLKSRAEREADRLEGGARAAPPPSHEAPHLGGDPEFLMLHHAISHHESALVKISGVIADLGF